MNARSLDFLRKRIPRQRIVRNAFWLALGIGLAGAGDFLLSVYVIRKFGATEYGKFAYALSFVSLFSSLFDFGIATVLVREFARDRLNERYLSDLVTLKSAIGLIGLIIVSFAGFFVSSDPTVHRMIAILCLYVILVELANLFYGVFRSRQRMEFEALFRIGYVICLGTTIVAFTTLRPTILSLGFAYVASIGVVVLALLLAVPRVANLHLSFRLSFGGQVWYQFAAAGVFIALAKAAGDVLTNVGTVILGHVGRLAEVGWYSAATKINGLLLFPMSMVASAVYPALVEALAGNPAKFIRYWNTWAKITIIVSFLLAALVFAEAEAIVGLLYPHGFLPAAWTLKILIFAACLIYLQTLYYHALLIFNRQREILYGTLVGTFLNVLLNVILAPRFGVYGVATAAVLTQSVLVGIFAVLTLKYTTVRPAALEFVELVLICAVSAALMNGALVRLSAHGTSLYLTVPAGVLLYLGLVGAFIQIWKRVAPRPRGNAGAGGKELASP